MTQEDVSRCAKLAMLSCRVTNPCRVCKGWGHIWIAPGIPNVSKPCARCGSKGVDVDKRFEEWMGRAVTYTSRSGKPWQAKVVGIPDNPWHDAECLGYPTLSLELVTEQGKRVRKDRVLPYDKSCRKTAVWQFP